jgi:hypothetical protein
MESKPSLRTLIIEEIKMYGWLDLAFTVKHQKIQPYSQEEYVTWLKSLEDDDLLASYRVVTERSNALD